jgi:SET domain-containing protein
VHWSASMQQLFRQYAYPLSDEVYALWDTDPTQWAPQNHSCAPNTTFDGLDVVAMRPIAVGEELTIDYAQSMNADSEPFDCRCGAASCRGWVTGTAGNSVSARERAAARTT